MLYRSKPQNELGTDKIGGMFKEANHSHPHFHILVSLPGLNGSVAKRRGDQFSKGLTLKIVRLSHFVIPYSLSIALFIKLKGYKIRHIIYILQPIKSSIVNRQRIKIFRIPKHSFNFSRDGRYSPIRICFIFPCETNP